MNIRLWHSPFNGGHIWFSRKALLNCRIGYGDIRKDNVNWSFWWSIFGICGGFVIQSWPWGKRP